MLSSNHTELSEYFYFKKYFVWISKLYILIAFINIINTDAKHAHYGSNHFQLPESFEMKS